ncbi:hypothetical protein D3C87_2148260 [compost metagenome]
MNSPMAMGRSQISMIPAAILASVPWSAKAMARPAAPSTVMIEAVETPSRLNAVTTAKMTMP